MRILSAIALSFILLFSTPVLANSTASNNIDVSSLSDADRAAIKQLVENKVVAKKTEDNIDTISKYADLGVNIGKAIGGVAREVGIEINNFANSDVGKMATFVIIFKLVGMDLIALAVAPIASLAGMFVGWRFIRMYGTPRQVTKYNRNKAGEILSETTEIIENTDGTFFCRIIGYVTIMASWIIGVAILV